MTNKKIEELLKIYEIDLHLLGKLHYDEFIEELETLLQESNKEAFGEVLKRINVKRYEILYMKEEEAINYGFASDEEQEGYGTGLFEAQKIIENYLRQEKETK